MKELFELNIFPNSLEFFFSFYLYDDFYHTEGMGPASPTVPGTIIMNCLLLVTIFSMSRILHNDNLNICGQFFI